MTESHKRVHRMQPFCPDPLPVPGSQLCREDILIDLGRANRALARYDGALGAMPNPKLLLAPLSANEALLSSRIEGTVATLDEILEADAGAAPPEGRSEDIKEVSNYRAAISVGADLLEQRGLSLAMIRELHQRLMQNVRGFQGAGALRETQNWIGARGSALEQARFVPPDPIVMREAMDKLADYLATSPEDPVLVTAVAHAQFEIIHPFLDGNGRVGRMLIPLILAHRQVIAGPCFYISQFLEAHRDAYYDRLLTITAQGDWTGWVRYFCSAVASQAAQNLDRVRALATLEAEMRQAFAGAMGSKHASSAVDAFFKRPSMTGPEFMAAVGLDTRATSGNMLRRLEKAGLITCVERGAGRRPSRYTMRRLIRVAEGSA